MFNQIFGYIKEALSFVSRFCDFLGLELTHLGWSDQIVVIPIGVTHFG